MVLLHYPKCAHVDALFDLPSHQSPCAHTYTQMPDLLDVNAFVRASEQRRKGKERQRERERERGSGRYFELDRSRNDLLHHDILRVAFCVGLWLASVSRRRHIYREKLFFPFHMHAAVVHSPSE